MNRVGKSMKCGRLLRGLTALFLLGAGMGLSCDSDAAAEFRSVATSPIGEGVRTIMNGILDGVIAAVQNAGDGDTSASD